MTLVHVEISRTSNHVVISLGEPIRNIAGVNHSVYVGNGIGDAQYLKQKAFVRFLRN